MYVQVCILTLDPGRDCIELQFFRTLTAVRALHKQSKSTEIVREVQKWLQKYRNSERSTEIVREVQKQLQKYRNSERSTEIVIEVLKQSVKYINNQRETDKKLEREKNCQKSTEIGR